ncbi:MAG: 2-oxo acid dehydrogenase subunit E2 [Verrucomicrobiota bacterium]|nr:2-oxo acid dehydrogenase subunit E2 [Verrucomicrobiota bacterium]
MPLIPIIMPQLGESIAEANIVSYLVQPGQEVAADQNLIEVETNKATMTVTSPCTGRLMDLTGRLQQSYPVGAVLGHIEASLQEAARLGLDVAPVAKSGDAEHPATPAGNGGSHARVQPTVRGLPVPANARGASYLSPRLKARMTELGLHAADLSGVAGSGAAGRVTVEDFEKFIALLEKQKISDASSMRVSVADAMRRSWTRPIAHVGMPVCLDPLFAYRKVSRPKPGPALCALRALAVALAENSAPAGRLVGSKIVHPSAIDIGFAVEAEDGVLVPVIRQADKKSLNDLVAPYNELVALARERKLPVNATGGSIATVTNFGTFGLEWATPIPLPEQTLVLGMGAARHEPHWDSVKAQFVPIMEANLTLSFDHRVLDGGAAGRLLQRIGELMREPEKL